MCDRAYDSFAPISVIGNSVAVNSALFVILPQRAGRVRLVVSLGNAGTVQIYAVDSGSDNLLAAVTNPGNPVTIDFNHWGRLITGQIKLYNAGAGVAFVNYAEHIQALEDRPLSLK